MSEFAQQYPELGWSMWAGMVILSYIILKAGS